MKRILGKGGEGRALSRRKDFPKEIHFPDGEREREREYRATARHGNRESIYRDDSYQLPARS